jgi:peptidoglycan/xylan/chitin deacetylase (PgdA/CDA1 family)
VAEWSDIERELDEWATAGRAIDLWLRDDDAAEPHPALVRLLELTGAAAIPLALAVIPARAADDLAAQIEAAPHATVLQHGYAHINHAGPKGKKSELGPERPAEVVIGEIATGWERLDRLFGSRAIPVLVPPWNRIGAHLVPMLPEIGYRGLSTFGARPRAEAAPGLAQINTHVDIIDWKGSRGFAGETTVLSDLLRTLKASRSGPADATEPIGVLTHHLNHDQACWAFLEALLTRASSHPATRWCDAGSLFGGVRNGGQR